VADEVAAPPEARDRQAKTFVVMNPVAGTTDPDEARQLIEDALQSSGIEFDIHLTRKDDNLQEIVTKAIDGGCRRVAAIGGDGTVSLVAAALVNRQVPLGILPAGSGNVLARDLGIPLDLQSALELFIDGTRIRTLDAMQVGEKYFFLNVSAGLSSLTMRRTRRSDKRRFGMLAYLWRGLEQLRRFRPQIFRVVVDGEEMSLPASEVLVANASFMGINPYFTLDREICPDDGVIDMCVVLSRKIGDIPALAFELVTRRPLKAPTLNCRPAHREIVLDSQRRLPVQADGELAGYTPVRIKIIPQALQVIVPAAPEAA
jgi:YegS/Rv2252/BmrU family lipid kinase